MKILILSLHTGEGHNSAALALKNAFSSLGAESVIADPVSLKSESAGKIVASLYNNLIAKKPAAFGALYSAGSLYSAAQLPSPIYGANAMCAGALRNFIVSEGFDAVVSTHLYGMEACTAMRRRFGEKISCYGVLTDYTCIPFLKDVLLDACFVPHESVRREVLSKCGKDFPAVVTGIPADRKFSLHSEKNKARELLELPPDKKIMLIMTGGVGCGNPAALCDAAMNLPEDIYVCVLTGKNETLRRELGRRFGYSRVKAVPFTSAVNLYMNASDVLITKAGGLSSTEAAVANIPIVHIDLIPGCETKNAQLFSSLGMSLRAREESEAVLKAYGIISAPELSEQIKASQRKNINPNAASDIAKTVLNT